VITEEETAVLVKAMMEEAQRLGFTWTIRPATVNTIDGTGVSATGIYDGDAGAVAVPMINIAGAGPGERVYVWGIPEGGNYIVGYASPHDPIIKPYGIHDLSVADSTASATFVAMAAPSSFTFVKRRSDTRVRVQMVVGYFVTNTNTGIEAGVTFDGGTNTLRVFRNGATVTALVHIPANGINYHPQAGSTDLPLLAGEYTVQGQWRRSVGSGNVQRDAQDWLSIECIEVAP
jgi:hypothetical protein